MKPEFMRLRRALAGTVAALLLASGLVVMSPALSASAHHNDIYVSAACNDHVWTITWRVVNSEQGLAEKITSSSDESIIPDNTVIGKGGSYTETETVNGPVTKTLRISAEWTNGTKHTAEKTINKSDFTGTCEAPDSPDIDVTASTCSSQSASNGTISFSLTGVTKTYTVALLAGDTTKATKTSTGGSGSFSNVAPGTYRVKASVSGGASDTSGPITVTTCAPPAPDLDLVIQPCAVGGTLGAVTANLSGLVADSRYLITLYSSSDVELDTFSLTATATTYSTSFLDRGPGEYYVTVSDSTGDLLTRSADATIEDCTPELTIAVQLEPCIPPLAGTDRVINAHLDGLAASTVYTVQLVTDDAAHTVVASTTTPGDSATTFAHSFTEVPSPGDYVVRVLGATAPLVSDPISAPLCDLTTLAPPSIELQADQCDGVDPAVGALSARMIDLDATKTYYVRVVDESGDTVPGGEDQTITGSTTATTHFPDITTPGTYTAQLLIDPGKQLAASSPSSVDLEACLPTLAMTGPGVLVPLGGAAALLLTLGGVLVMSRLRRRMAL